MYNYGAGRPLCIDNETAIAGLPPFVHCVWSAHHVSVAESVAA